MVFVESAWKTLYDSTLLQATLHLYFQNLGPVFKVFRTGALDANFWVGQTERLLPELWWKLIRKKQTLKSRTLMKTSQAAIHVIRGNIFLVGVVWADNNTDFQFFMATMLNLWTFQLISMVKSRTPKRTAVRIDTLEWFSNFNFVCVFKSFRKP